MKSQWLVCAMLLCGLIVIAETTLAMPDLTGTITKLKHVVKPSGDTLMVKVTVSNVPQQAIADGGGGTLSHEIKHLGVDNRPSSQGFDPPQLHQSFCLVSSTRPCSFMAMYGW